MCESDIDPWKIRTVNIANLLTKALSQEKHEAHMSSMGIRYLHDWL